LALFVEGFVGLVCQAFKTRFQLSDVFECPGFFDGAFEHEGVRGALSEAEELDHEHGVVATGFTLLEEGIEVCPEAVLGLKKSPVNCSSRVGDNGDSRFGKSIAPQEKTGYIESPDGEEGA
jgi:hypothetical protein